MEKVKTRSLHAAATRPGVLPERKPPGHAGSRRCTAWRTGTAAGWRAGRQTWSASAARRAPRRAPCVVFQRQWYESAHQEARLPHANGTQCSSAAASTLPASPSSASSSTVPPSSSGVCLGLGHSPNPRMTSPIPTTNPNRHFLPLALGLTSFRYSPSPRAPCGGGDEVGVEDRGGRCRAGPLRLERLERPPGGGGGWDPGRAGVADGGSRRAEGC